MNGPDRLLYTYFGSQVDLLLPMLIYYMYIIIVIIKALFELY